MASDDILYEAVSAALELLGCDIGAAECHGILCGMLCGSIDFDPNAWLDHAFGYDETINIEELGRGHALHELVEETMDGFAADDFSLRVLLPDEHDPVHERALALGAWCRGFLSGFGLGESIALDKLSEDSRGFLNDLQAIGRVEPTTTNEQDDEYALMEVCEYARMGALLLREETLFLAEPHPGDVSIH